VGLLPSLSRNWEREGSGMGEGECGDVQYLANQGGICPNLLKNGREPDWSLQKFVKIGAD